MNRRHKEEFLDGCRIAFGRLVRKGMLPQHIEEVFWDYLMEHDFDISDIKKKMQRGFKAGTVDYGMVGKELANIAVGGPPAFVVQVSDFSFEPVVHGQLIRYQESYEGETFWDVVILYPDQVNDMIWLQKKSDVFALIVEVRRLGEYESDMFAYPTILSKYSRRGIGTLDPGTIVYTRHDFVEPVEEEDAEFSWWWRVRVIGSSINESQVGILRKLFRHLIPMGE